MSCPVLVLIPAAAVVLTVVLWCVLRPVDADAAPDSGDADGSDPEHDSLQPYDMSRDRVGVPGPDTIMFHLGVLAELRAHQHGQVPRPRAAPHR